MKDLQITASANSSENDFDFFVGSWKIHNRKLNKRLADCDEWTEFEAKSECRKLLRGFANTDSFSATFDGKPFEGMTLRLFNPLTKLWSIYWADSNVVVLDVGQVGSLVAAAGEPTRAASPASAVSFAAGRSRDRPSRGP